MLTSLVLSMAIAAPVPAPAPPVPTGPAPRILELKPDAEGKIRVNVLRPEKVQVGAANVIAPPNGAAPAVITREITRSKIVELSEVKDLTVTTADGKKLDRDEAIKKLSTGGTVVVSTDGKPVSPAFLKMFKDDVLVLASPELSGPAARAGVRPLPAEIQNVPGVQILPAQPAIQIQIAPALPVVPPQGK